MKERIKLFIPLIIFAVLAGLFFAIQVQIKGGDYDPKSMPSALVGKTMPNFSLKTLPGGEAVDSEALRGQVALVNVWATWCPSCYYEHEFLNELAGRGVVIYGVDYKDDAAAAHKWLSDKGNPYRLNLFDDGGTLGLDLGVTGAPETYVIDHQGVIHMRHQGPLDEKIWQDKIKPMMEKLENLQGEKG